jgi:hypothetical protein
MITTTRPGQTGLCPQCVADARRLAQALIQRDAARASFDRWFAALDPRDQTNAAYERLKPRETAPVVDLLVRAIHRLYNRMEPSVIIPWEPTGFTMNGTLFLAIPADLARLGDEPARTLEPGTWKILTVSTENVRPI